MTGDPKNQGLEGAKNEIPDILRRVDSLPLLDTRAEDEIIGYDELGIPQSEDRCPPKSTS